MPKLLKVAVVATAGFALAILFVPGFFQFIGRALRSSETVIVPASAGDLANGVTQGQELKIVTLLGFDGIPAILDPSFVSVPEAQSWMEPDEQVLGLSIDGDHRAYSVRMLSRHEIVNDVVGGVPVAVTW